MSCQNPGIFRDYTVKQGINFVEIDLHAEDEIPDLNQFDGLCYQAICHGKWI